MSSGNPRRTFAHTNERCIWNFVTSAHGVFRALFLCALNMHADVTQAGRRWVAGRSWCNCRVCASNWALEQVLINSACSWEGTWPSSCCNSVRFLPLQECECIGYSKSSLRSDLGVCEEHPRHRGSHGARCACLATARRQVHVLSHCTPTGAHAQPLHASRCTCSSTARLQVHVISHCTPPGARDQPLFMKQTIYKHNGRHWLTTLTELPTFIQLVKILRVSFDIYFT